MKYSIIIPVYNSERTIERCVRRIIEYNNVDLEVILVENGSSDNSYAKCNQLSQRYNNVICLRNDEKGVSKARNSGILKAKGDIISFCDADDLFAKGIFTVVDHYFEKYKPDILVGAYCYFASNKRIQYSLGRDKEIDIIDFQGMVLNDQRILGSVWNKFYKKTIIGNVRFPEEITVCEDMLFNMKLLNTGNVKKIYYCNKYTYAYIQNTDSVTNKRVILDEYGRTSVQKAVYKLISEVNLSKRVLSEARYNIVNSAIANLYSNRLERYEREYLYKQIKDYYKDYLSHIYKYGMKHNCKMVCSIGLRQIKRLLGR